MGRAPPKSALTTDATPSRTTGFHDKMCHTASRQSNPPPLLHHLTAACALVAQMRTKSTARTVSHFCVRPCLLFTVIAHVQPPLLKIREEESARTSSSHRHFFEYLSPIPLLHHTLCSNDTKIPIQEPRLHCWSLRTYHTTHILSYQSVESVSLHTDTCIG